MNDGQRPTAKNIKIPQNNFVFFSFSRNLVRNSRQNQLQSVDNSTSDQVFLGKQGKDFEFAHLSQPIDVIECSTRDDKIENLHRWLKTLN